MQPTNIDNVTAVITGPKGDPGDATSADIAAAIAALKSGVDPAGDTLAELYALILARARLDDVAAFSVSPTVPTLAPGNNSSKVANSAYVRQELINYALALAGGSMTGPLILAADPVAALQAATKQYVDAFIQGISNKYSALCATAAALATNTYANGTSGVGATLTATANGALAVDGQSPPAGSYVLVKNEVAALGNGLYQVTQAGDGSHPWILTRAVDDDTAAEMAGAFCFVELGTVNNKTGWLCGQSGITIGTTAITFTQFSGAGTYTAGTGLQLIGSQFSITVVPVANGGTNASSASGTALDNISGFSSTGHLIRTGAGTYVFRTNTAPAAGLTISNPDGVSGNMTFALANDLAALEGLSTTGFAKRTGTDTWSLSASISLTADVSGVLPVANGGSGNTGGAWTATTPTVSPIGGPGTFAATAVLHTLQEGKKVHVQLVVTITNIGTATGFSVPYSVAPAQVTALTGTSLAGNMQNWFSSSGQVFQYNGVQTPVATTYYISGAYEAA